MHFAFTKNGTKIQVFISRFFPCHFEDFLKSADIYKKRKLEKWNSPCSVYSLQHLSTFFLTISKETHLSIEMDAFGFYFVRSLFVNIQLRSCSFFFSIVQKKISIVHKNGTNFYACGRTKKNKK